MDLFFILLVLLVTTRIFGEIAERIQLPALIGELIAGITLGTIASQHSELIPYINLLHQSEVFATITDLGMFFIMLYAGVELRPSRLIENSKESVVVASAGMLFPLLLGFGVGWIFLPDSKNFFTQALFLGTALAITAVPATVRILMDLNQLNSRSGQIIVSAAVFDDIISLILLTWLTALMEVQANNHFSLLNLLTKVGLFFLISTVIGRYIYPLGGKIMRNFKEKEFEISSLLIAAFAFSALAEMLDLHFIIGAFMAGLFFGRDTIDSKAYKQVEETTSAMTYGFLAPIFFASIGLNLDFSAVSQVPIFVFCFITIALIGKFIGAGGAALIVGLNHKDSAAIGAGMSARGAVELVIADIALKSGLFDNGGIPNDILDNLFSTVVIMAVVTTLITPILLKQIYANYR